MHEHDLDDPDDLLPLPGETGDQDGVTDEIGGALVLVARRDGDADDDPQRMLDPYAALSYPAGEPEGVPTASDRLRVGHAHMAGGQINDALHEYWCL